MKCSVCGNDLKENGTKCSVCGTAYDKSQVLSTAMSNISSLANALRAKREVNNNNKAFEEDLKRVATRAKDLEDLYTKDINLKINEEDVDDGFDLNAFYENSKTSDVEKNAEAEKANNIVFDEEDSEETEEIFKIDEEDEDVKKSLDEEDLDEEKEVDVDVEAFSLEEELNNSKDDEEEPENDEAEEETPDNYEEDKLVEEITEDDSNEVSADIDISKKFEEEDDSEEVEISVDVDGFEELVEEKNDNSNNENLGYIKESDIQTEAQQTNQEEISNNVENIENSIIQPDNTQNQLSTAIGQIETARVPANEANGEVVVSEEFATVKPEDVPYTELEEKSGGATSEDKPIVLSDNEIVGTSSATDMPSQEDSKSKDSQEKVKYNKFCGVMAKIFITLAILVFGVYLIHHFFLKDLEKSNAVFDFINNFLGNKLYLHYTLLGVMGALVLAILFSFFQLIFVKRRKMGAVLLLLSIIISGAVVGGLYYLEQLMPVISTLLSFFN